ncbi:MAG: hypothetical protein BJ554DRAFT_704, partial [Olpidium bornovanus]
PKIKGGLVDRLEAKGCLKIAKAFTDGAVALIRKALVRKIKHGKDDTNAMELLIFRMQRVECLLQISLHGCLCWIDGGFFHLAICLNVKQRGVPEAVGDGFWTYLRPGSKEPPQPSSGQPCRCSTPHGRPCLQHAEDGSANNGA